MAGWLHHLCVVGVAESSFPRLPGGGGRSDGADGLPRVSPAVAKVLQCAMEWFWERGLCGI